MGGILVNSFVHEPNMDFNIHHDMLYEKLNGFKLEGKIIGMTSDNA